MIYFNRPALVGNELKYIQDAVAQGMLCGDGKYTKLCSAWMKERFQVNQVFLTTSCTHALEMAAFLSDIQPGDEVIMPSYTFVSTADAFVLRGAKIVFVDIRPDTMNIDENLIEDAITEKTRAIVPVHYAGVGCEMNKIMEIARRHNLKVVEDAAQGVDAYYHGKALVRLVTLAVTVSMRQRISLWVKVVLWYSRRMNIRKKLRSCVKRERTEVNFSEDRLINIDGLIMDHPIFRAR